MQATPATPPTSPIEAEVLRIQGLLQAGRNEDAVSAAAALRRTVPENRDVLYMLAVGQRYLRRLGDALETLAQLEACHPTYSRLYQERGHCLLAAGKPAEALAAFLHAVNLNASLPGSWKALQVLFRSAGRPSTLR